MYHGGPTAILSLEADQLTGAARQALGRLALWAGGGGAHRRSQTGRRKKKKKTNYNLLLATTV